MMPLTFGMITGGAGLYVAGLLTYNLFGELALIDVYTFGFFTTLLLVLMTVIPTVISLYHFMMAIRSYWALNTEVWSDTARSLVGWRSFNPFRGLVVIARDGEGKLRLGGAFFSNKVSVEEFRLTYMGIASVAYVIGSVVTFLATPHAQGITGQVLRVCGGAFVGA